jgi:tetratricopeptide (TPR) repeat protein
VEKKAEKQNDFILKPESDEAAESGEVLPELVSGPDLDVSPTLEAFGAPQPSELTASATDPPIDLSAESQSHSPNPSSPDLVIEPQDASDTPIETGRLTGVGRAKKTAKPTFFRQNVLPLVLVILVLVVVLIPLKNAFVWYKEAPRTFFSGGVSFVPAIFTAWVGDADAAYALQLGATAMIESDPKLHGEKSQFRKITLKNAEQFVQQTGAPQSLTRLAASLAYTSEGRPKEASAVIRGVAENASNPLIKAYDALLLAGSGDMKAALSEIDQGLAIDKKGETYFGYGNGFLLWWEKAQILQAIGKPAEALAFLNSSECLASTQKGLMNSSDLLISKSSALLQLGEPDQAIALNEGIPAPNHITLFLAYLLKNDYERAFHEAHEISGTPNFALSRYYSQKGQLAEALDYAEKAEQKSRNLITLEQHVHVLNQLGRWKESLSISQDPSTFANLMNLTASGIQCQYELHALRAEAFANLGQSATAFVEAKMALDINPECRKALEAARLASANLKDFAKVAFYDDQIRRLTTPINYRPLFFIGASGE